MDPLRPGTGTSCALPYAAVTVSASTALPLQVINCLKGHDDKVRVILNKADQVRPGAQRGPRPPLRGAWPRQRVACDRRRGSGIGATQRAAVPVRHTILTEPCRWRVVEPCAASHRAWALCCAPHEDLH